MYKYIALSTLITLLSVQSPQALTKEPISPLSPKNISISIAITKDMLGYTHPFFGTHYPEFFKIIVNNQTYIIFDNNTLFSDKKTITIPVNSHSITAFYEYSFASGLYKGTEKVDIPVPFDKKKNYTLQFDWKNSQRIQLSAIPAASRATTP